MRVSLLLSGLYVLGGCVPLVESYYMPQSPGAGTELKGNCGWVNVVHKLEVSKGVEVWLLTSPTHRAGIDSMTIRILDSSEVRLQGDSLTITSPDFSAPVSQKTGSFRVESGSLSPTDTLHGPDNFTSFMEDLGPKERPQTMVVKLPDITVNSESHSLEPVTYVINRSVRIVGACM